MYRQHCSPGRLSRVKNVISQSSQFKNKQSSPLKGRASPCRIFHTNKLKIKPDLSASTEDSLKSQKYNEEDLANVIKTPTTIHEEPIGLDNIDEYLAQYFNSDYRNALFTPILDTTIKERLVHRYTHTLPAKELKPFRSETPEIPTRKPKEQKDNGKHFQEKLPKIEKKTKKSARARSPSPYDHHPKLHLTFHPTKLKPLCLYKLK